MKTELLPCTLSTEETIDRGEKLAAAIRGEERLAAELAAYKEKHKRAAAAQAYERERLTGIVESGIEHREVEVEEIPDYKRGVVAVVRRDTDALVRERLMDEPERQAALDLAKKAEKVKA